MLCEQPHGVAKLKFASRGRSRLGYPARGGYVIVQGGGWDLKRPCVVLHVLVQSQALPQATADPESLCLGQQPLSTTPATDVARRRSTRRGSSPCASTFLFFGRHGSPWGLAPTPSAQSCNNVCEGWVGLAPGEPWASHRPTSLAGDSNPRRTARRVIGERSS